MSSPARELSLYFSAGAIGAVANSLAAWGAGRIGLLHAVGVAIAPPLTPQWLYPRIVWGGIWGLLFILPLAPRRWLRQGLLVSLGPTLAQLLFFFPRAGKGLLGTELGLATPLVVLVLNGIWGATASLWIHRVGRS
jgi:hypothetical protein